VSSFVQSVQQVADAGTVASAFLQQSDGIKAALGDLGQSLTDVSSIRDAIASSNAGNLGRRAGSLCTQMQCKWLVQS
jgi:hypothetical protein